MNATKDTGAQIEKQKKILENRLEKAIVRFNESVGQNKALREEIDNLRRERVVFDNVRHNPRTSPLLRPRSTGNTLPALPPECPSLSVSLLEFPQIYRKIEKELQDKKREMANVIELSNISYEARDQARGCSSAFLLSLMRARLVLRLGAVPRARARLFGEAPRLDVPAVAALCL